MRVHIATFVAFHAPARKPLGDNSTKMLMEFRATPRLSERLTIERTTSAVKTLTFADDVREGLQADPKYIRPKWLYDDLGSALFDAICKLPEYDLTRVEGGILAHHARDIVALFADPLDLIELGSGSSLKTRHVIDAILARQPHLRYQPIDISDDALINASTQLVNRYPHVEISAHAGDYYTVLERGKLPRGERALVMFLGSNIGNSEPAEAVRLLRAIAQAIEPGDGLLLGVDLKKSPQALINAYDDATGVTAAFIKNVLGRMNRELSADFRLSKFAHRVEYDETIGAVTSYLESLEEQTVTILALKQSYRFARGERIHMESSYKFSYNDLIDLAETSGFYLKERFTDQHQRFCEALFIRK